MFLKLVGQNPAPHVVLQLFENGMTVFAPIQHVFELFDVDIDAFVEYLACNSVAMAKYNELEETRLDLIEKFIAKKKRKNAKSR